MAISRTAWVSRYQNISILDFIAAKDDGGGSDWWSYKMCQVPVKSSPSTNQHPALHRLNALPVTEPTVSKHCKEKCNITRNVILCTAVSPKP